MHLVKENQGIINEEVSVDTVAIVVDEPRSQKVVKNEEKSEKEEFEARSLQVFEKLFK